MKMSSSWVFPVALTLLGSACGEVGGEEEVASDRDRQLEELGVAADAVGLDATCDPGSLSGGARVACQVIRFFEGRRLFDHETFDGNGRRCVTCHSVDNGTLTIPQIQELLEDDPENELFQHDGTDDGVSGTSRIAEHGTIRVERPLPPWLKLANDPSATSIVVNRGIPTTRNVPALDDVFMYDLRNRTLQEQALGAIQAHAQNTVEPTSNELDLIAEFQRKSPRFFSSKKLFRFAQGGPAPTLPAGRTPSEQRGRAMFDDVPFTPGSTAGICAHCHSGAMLDESNEFNLFGAPPGVRFFDVGVNARNLPGNPVYDFLIENADGSIVPWSSPDPGVLLTDPVLAEIPPFLPLWFFVDNFKTPTVWGVKDTAPYFHDNSAKSLEDVASQYTFFFDAFFGIQITPQDQADMVAYMKLL